MTPDKQLVLWVDGKSVHNDERDECCPDFSCCQPDLLADRALRVKFKAAVDQNDNISAWVMLGMFLSGALTKANPNKQFHIAGEEAGNV